MNKIEYVDFDNKNQGVYIIMSEFHNLKLLIDNEDWEEFKKTISPNNINDLGSYGENILFYIIKEGGFRWELFDHAMKIKGINLSITITQDEIKPQPKENATALDLFILKHSFQEYKKGENIFDYAKRLNLEAWISRLEKYQLENTISIHNNTSKNIKL
jgi:hypothetical protein